MVLGLGDGRASRRRRADVRQRAVRNCRHLVALEDEVCAALEEAADLGGARGPVLAVGVAHDVVAEDVRLALAVVGERVGVQFLPADGDVFDFAVQDLQRQTRWQNTCQEPCDFVRLGLGDRRFALIYHT